MQKKATIDAKAFSEGLDQVSKTLQKSSYPALSEVSVRVEDGVCILTATDLDTWLIKRIPAQGDNLAFVFTRTREVAKACRLFEGNLVLELEEISSEKNKEWRLFMRCGSRAAQFDVMDPEMYPVYPSFEAESSFSVNAAALYARAERVSYAALDPTPNTQPNRTSIQFSGPYVFALDGNQMACDTDPAFIFPRSFTASKGAVSHLKPFGKQDVKIEFGKGRVRITDDTFTLDFRIPSMDLYAVEQAIPQSCAESFAVSPKDFLRELKYLKGFAVKERHPYVRFRAGELVMPVSSGTYRAAVQCVGENRITFAFDLNRMIVALRQFKDAPSVQIKVNSAISPFIIEAEGRSDLALVCPIRLSEKLMAA